MDRNEAAAERRHSEVLNTIRDAMEITTFVNAPPV